MMRKAQLLLAAVWLPLCVPVGAQTTPSTKPEPLPQASSPAPAPHEPVKKSPPASEPFYMKYLGAGTLDQMIRLQTARVDADPKNAALRNDLGNLLVERKFSKEAIEQYRVASKLDKHFFLADYNEGLAFENEGKIGPAIRAYRRSIARKPGFPQSHFHLGYLYERRGEEDAAVAEYARALRIDNSMRDPARNPLAVQTRLLDRASLSNYRRDLAGAVQAGDEEFADTALFRKLPVSRPIASEEIAPSGPNY